MFLHYLKVAVRNLSKSKLQTFVSLLGLSIAFACASLAVYWNYYEVTFDTFHQNADRIYRVCRRTYDHKLSTETMEALAAYMKERYPEVERACAYWKERNVFKDMTVDGVPFPENLELKCVAPDLVEMFDFDWIAGSKNVSSWADNQIAIADNIARQVCGEESPIGKRITSPAGKEYEIVGVYKAWPRHTHFSFDAICRLRYAPDGWSKASIGTYVMLYPNADSRRLLQKMQRDTIFESGMRLVYDGLTPLTAVHYTHPSTVRNIRLNDVQLFAGAAILLSLCALLNYLTLFISRFRIRGRDMALRVICGSSSWQMAKLLLTEYLLLLLGASILGILLIELFMNKFVELSQLNVERLSVYAACACLMLLFILFASLLAFGSIWYFRRKALRVQIDAAPVRIGGNRLRIAGICLQLFVSFLFMFCSVVMMKQVYFLVHADINIERKQIACFQSSIDADRIADLLRSIPSVTEVLPLIYALYPVSNPNVLYAKQWESKAMDAPPVGFHLFEVNDTIARFYGLRMKEGPQSFNLEKGEVFINETLARKLDMLNPVGKMLDNRYRIKGVIYDYQTQAPTTPVQAICFEKASPYAMSVAFKYVGDFASCKKALIEAYKKMEFPPSQERLRHFIPTIKDGEETYNSYMTSEYNLLKLLGFITVVSLLVALFGVYALIVQESERYRKEIAIRKVNGAHVRDIFLLFFKQYLMQLLIAAAFAFSIGYVYMKRWLQGYTRQTEMNLWIYLTIFFVVAALVMLCIGWRVWKVANENPAAVIKKE